MPSFGKESLEQLATCDTRLQVLFAEVIKAWDCKVTQGKRTEAESLAQQAAGTSHTAHSKHVYPLDGPSLAVDVAAYPVNYSDYKRQLAFSGFVLGVAHMLGIPIRWGGDWNSNRDLNDQIFNDLVHFEIRE